MWIEVVPVDDGPLIALILGKMAYPFMFIATGIMCLANKSLQNVIPGHPILSFLVLACGAMVLTFLIMQLVLIGSAFSALGCMIILSVLFYTIMCAIQPDSVQYFILLTVVFSAISLPLCYLNLSWDSGRIHIRGLSCIVAGILNAYTAAFYITTIGSAWEECPISQGNILIENKILDDSIVANFLMFPSSFASVPGAVMFYIILAVICLGAFAATIIYDRKNI